MKKEEETKFRYEIVARISRDTTIQIEDWKKQIAGDLRGLGNSLDIYISPSGKRSVIHIHTNTPEEVKRVITVFSEIGTRCRFEEQDLNEQLRGA